MVVAAWCGLVLIVVTVVIVDCCGLSLIGVIVIGLVLIVVIVVIVVDCCGLSLIGVDCCYCCYCLVLFASTHIPTCLMLRSDQWLTSRAELFPFWMTEAPAASVQRLDFKIQHDQ